MSLTLVTRSGKGSPLTGDEHDANLAALEAAAFPSDILVIRSTADLPDAVGDEHILPSKTVLLAASINIGSNALRLSTGTLLRGLGGQVVTSSNASGVIRATNVGSAVVMREFIVVATGGPALALTGTTTYQLNCFFMGIYGASVGTITGFDVQAFKDCFFDTTDGLTLDGTTSKVFLSQCPFYGITTGNAAIRLSDTLNCGVADIVTCFFKFDDGTCIEAESGYTVGEGRLRGSLIEGTATPLDGLTPADIEWDMSQNTGIRDSRVSGQLHINTSATTTIDTQSTPVKVAGTTTPEAINERFSHSDNRLTYTGTLPVLVEVNGTAVTAAGDNESVSFFIAKNGTVISASESTVGSVPVSIERFGAVITLVEMETNDYIEIWIQNNDSAGNIEVVGLNLTASG